VCAELLFFGQLTIGRASLQLARPWWENSFNSKHKVMNPFDFMASF
jgi:hypothetical protein